MNVEKAIFRTKTIFSRLSACAPQVPSSYIPVERLNFAFIYDFTLGFSHSQPWPVIANFERAYLAEKYIKRRMIYACSCIFLRLSIIENLKNV